MALNASSWFSGAVGGQQALLPPRPWRFGDGSEALHGEATAALLSLWILILKFINLNLAIQTQTRAMN